MQFKNMFLAIAAVLVANTVVASPAELPELPEGTVGIVLVPYMEKGIKKSEAFALGEEQKAFWEKSQELDERTREIQVELEEGVVKPSDSKVKKHQESLNAQKKALRILVGYEAAEGEKPALAEGVTSLGTREADQSVALNQISSESTKAFFWGGWGGWGWGWARVVWIPVTAWVVGGCGCWGW